MQRKRTKQSRGANTYEKHYHGFCKQSSCIACGYPPPSIVHHCEGSTFKHNKTLIGHRFTIPLCQSCDDIVTNQSRKVFRETIKPQSVLWVSQNEKYEEYLSEQGIDEKYKVPYDEYLAIVDWGR